MASRREESRIVLHVVVSDVVVVVHGDEACAVLSLWDLRIRPQSQTQHSPIIEGNFFHLSSSLLHSSRRTRPPAVDWLICFHYGSLSSYFSSLAMQISSRFSVRMKLSSLPASATVPMQWKGGPREPERGGADRKGQTRPLSQHVRSESQLLMCCRQRTSVPDWSAVIRYSVQEVSSVNPHDFSRYVSAKHRRHISLFHCIYFSHITHWHARYTYF
jgi:hypothetical protein